VATGPFIHPVRGQDDANRICPGPPPRTRHISYLASCALCMLAFLAPSAIPMGVPIFSMQPCVFMSDCSLPRSHMSFLCFHVFHWHSQAVFTCETFILLVYSVRCARHCRSILSPLYARLHPLSKRGLPIVLSRVRTSARSPSSGKY
jgi:hypothetical protein